MFLRVGIVCILWIRRNAAARAINERSNSGNAYTSNLILNRLITSLDYYLFGRTYGPYEDLSIVDKFSVCTQTVAEMPFTTLSFHLAN